MNTIARSLAPHATRLWATILTATMVLGATGHAATAAARPGLSCAAAEARGDLLPSSQALWDPQQPAKQALRPGRGQLQLTDGRAIAGSWRPEGAMLHVAARKGQLRIPLAKVQRVWTEADLKDRLRELQAKASHPGAQLQVARTARDWGLLPQMWKQLDKILRGLEKQQSPPDLTHRSQARRVQQFLGELAPELLGWEQAAGLRQGPQGAMALAVAETLKRRPKKSRVAAVHAVLAGMPPLDVCRAARQATYPYQRIAAIRALSGAEQAGEEESPSAGVGQPSQGGSAPGKPALQRESQQVVGQRPSPDPLEAFLWRTCILDRHSDVRRAAAVETRDSGGSAAAVRYLQGGLSHPDKKVRVRTAEAFAVMAHKDALPILVAAAGSAGRGLAGAGGGNGVRAHVAFTTQTSYVRDFDVEVASAAAIADPKVDVLSSGTVLDVTVGGISVQRVQVLGAYRNALGSLGGSDPGADPRAWPDWYAGILDAEAQAAAGAPRSSNG